MIYALRFMDAPVGKIKLVASDKGFAAILWEDEGFERVKLSQVELNEHHPVLLETERQLTEYFDGKRRQFDIELDFKGTDFQIQVWKALLTIPFGETRSYMDIARILGDSKAVRAVGAANGKNPVSIIVPCHRVIGSSGKLTGFAGGLKNKAFLLRLERNKGAVKEIEKHFASEMQTTLF